MNPEDGATNLVVENPQKVLFYIWVKTKMALNIPMHERNGIHDATVEASRKYGAIPCIASITISSASKGGNLIPKCGVEYYTVLNGLEEILTNPLTRSDCLGN